MKGSKGEMVIHLMACHNSCILCDKYVKSETWAGYINLIFKDIIVAKVKTSEIAFIEYF